jgi:nucleotide-binding universal stress UspA family protein
MPDLMSLDTYSVLNESLPASLQAYLEAKKAELGNLVTSLQIRCGPAAPEILAHTEANPTDIIVMASHGRGGLGTWLLGGVTTKVVRSSVLPVLVVAGSDAREPRLETIMVALDGSACSEREFDRALSLARAVGAELVLYQAVKMGWSGADPEPEMSKAEAYLQSLAERCQGIPFRVRVYPTDGWPYIVERAEELKADLVVMGSHGRRALERFFMGSETERVIHQARLPVLVVH